MSKGNRFIFEQEISERHRSKVMLEAREILKENKKGATKKSEHSFWEKFLLPLMTSGAVAGLLGVIAFLARKGPRPLPAKDMEIATVDIELLQNIDIVDELEVLEELEFLESEEVWKELEA